MTDSLSELATSTTPGFAHRWTDLPPPDRSWLEHRTQAVTEIAYRSACDAVRIGQILRAVRKRLPQKFKHWLSVETPFSRRTAYRFIAVAEVFENHLCQIGTLEPCALYLLAQDAVPQQAREHAIQLADSGERVTRAKALEIVSAYRVSEPDKSFVKQYEKLRADLDKRTVVSQQPNGTAKVSVVDQSRVTRRCEAQDSQRRMKIGLAIEELMTARGATLIRIEQVDDPEDITLYSVTCHTPQRGVENQVGKYLKGALLRLADISETKYCPGCCAVGGGLPSEMFNNNRAEPDGLADRCKKCERARKKDYKKRKKTGKVKKRGRPRGAAA